MIRFNKPNIRTSRDSEKIEELKRYLFTLVDDLQFSMQALENDIKKLKEQVSAMSISTANYNEATADAMAYVGEMPEVVPTDEVETTNDEEINNDTLEETE